MNASTPLAHLSADIYERYARHGAGGMKFFGPFAEALRAHDPSEVVALQVKLYPLLYVTDFLLSFPALVSAMDSIAWSRALLAAGPRPQLLPNDIQMEQQADVYFVCKFLRLDAVHFALSCDAMPHADKEKILLKARLSAPLLILDEVDQEDLDGVHFVSQTLLQETSDKLYAEGGWARLPNCRESVIERFRALTIEH